MTSSPATAPSVPSERAIIFLVGVVQFVNILDFMMVMPLGPDFARALGIPASRLGFIGGSYTAAAAVSGLAGSLFLDRFDRRPALALAMAGLVMGTAAGGLATGMTTLMLARVVAGAFGGPATSLALSVVADVIPVERRGKARGSVMTAFSVASVLGVPAGLELARLGSWRTPFFAVAALGLAVSAGAWKLLPPLRRHLAARAVEPAPPFSSLVRRGSVLLSYSMTATAMMGGFILIPNISPYVQLNLGYPREHLGLLYFAGGICSFAAMRGVGPLVDRIGGTRVATFGTAVLLAATYAGFVMFPSPVPVLAVFIGFMLASAFRNVAYNTLTSRVPGPAERARFMSIQSAVQHMASATGAFVSAQILTERSDHKLAGMPVVATISMALMGMLPLLMWLVEAELRRRPVALAAGPPSPVVH